MDKLSLIYDKRQKDFVVKYPLRCDGALIMNTIVGDVLHYTLTGNPYPHNFTVFNLVEELEKRGYDITTLKFSIEKKQDNE